MAADQADLDFLVLLVHRGHLPRERAKTLLPRLEAGEPLDELLASLGEWSPEEVARLRRTNAGEVPEIPGFDVLGKLGVGGTAEVFRARERKTGRNLALKILRPDYARQKSFLRAFVDEAKLLQRLDHPGLVKGYGVARSGSTVFSRLEFIPGRTVLEWLDDGRRFDEAGALRIVLEVAEVLAYLEGEGIVHRDVKPGNVMLTDDDRVKLFDLGFAATSDHTPAGEAADSTVGTVAYLSPEQARGAAGADARSDIYSLGVSLFHIAVGRLPFESSDDREVLRMQVMESLTSPELKGRGISSHLHYFIEKMMAKDASHRFQNWSELIGEIREMLRGRDSLDFEAEARAELRRTPRRRRR